MVDWDFEAPLKKMIESVAELAQYPGDPDKERELVRLKHELDERRREIFSKLTPWQTTMVARHPNRPYTLDYVQALFTEFTEFHGDRRFADDPAIVCGFALYKGRPVAIVGHQKGRDMKQKIHRNFGCPKPEGYRKALRVMKIAAKFKRPIITFVDTPGAYPGIDAEERGQAEAIAFNLREMSRLRTPIIVNVTGEGGSGGALAIAVGDKVNMLEFAIYSVISPEGCASILWRDAREADRAASAMKIAAKDLKRYGIVDEIVPEPAGGAHLDHEAVFRSLDAVIAKQLRKLKSLRTETLVAERYRKFRNMGRLGQEFIQEDVASDAVIDE
jgi:acetyl-CoA carboxylase carboxyl transferase subunit alpha